jgi:hypothetical protein
VRFVAVAFMHKDSDEVQRGCGSNCRQLQFDFRRGRDDSENTNKHAIIE